MVRNKRAQLGHGITWLWKFILLILVIGGTVVVVAGHYSKQYDIRDTEASVISRKLVECIAPEGIYTDLTLEKVKSCLAFNEEEIYLNISIENINVELGKSFLATLCEAKEKKTTVKSYPSCLRTSYIVLKQTEPEPQQETLSIFIAIRKTEKNL